MVGEVRAGGGLQTQLNTGRAGQIAATGDIDHWPVRIRKRHGLQAVRAKFCERNGFYDRHFTRPCHRAGDGATLRRIELRAKFALRFLWPFGARIGETIAADDRQ